MKLIDLLCKASAVLHKFGRDEAFCASPPIREYLDEHDRLQRIAENMDKQCHEQARELASAMQQPINIQIQIEKER